MGQTAVLVEARLGLQRLVLYDVVAARDAMVVAIKAFEVAVGRVHDRFTISE